LAYSKCISSLYGITGSKIFERKSRPKDIDEITTSSTAQLNESNEKQYKICFEIKYF
jgi:hypothetical protein